MPTNYDLHFENDVLIILLLGAALLFCYYFILKSSKESNEETYLKCIGFAERHAQLLFQLQMCNEDEHLESLHTKISNFEKDYKGKVPAPTLSLYLKQLYQAYHSNKYKLGKTITTAYSCTEGG